MPAAAFVAVLVFAGTNYFLWSDVVAPTGDHGTDTSSHADARQSTSAAAAGRSAERSRIASGNATEQCRERIAAAEQVVDAAEPGVENWRAHVRARADGLAGRISAEEMRAIWKRTRLGGPDDVTRFRAAERHYTNVAGECSATTTGAASEAARNCVASAATAAEAVAAAGAAVGDWARHQEHMRMFADGGMTAEHAQRAWEQASSEAPINITRYDDAVLALERAPSCEPAGQPGSSR